MMVQAPGLRKDRKNDAQSSERIGISKPTTQGSQNNSLCWNLVQQQSKVGYTQQRLVMRRERGEGSSCFPVTNTSC